MNTRPLLLNKNLALEFARTAVVNITREYPNAPNYLLHGGDDLKPPREVHPSFFGSLDWHSSVHQHWLLVHLLRRFPTLEDIRATLNMSLTKTKLQVEVDYLEARPGFERTYGWTWALKLHQEADSFLDDDSKRWAESLAPLAELIAKNWMEFLPKAAYPIRAGTHGNSAFGLCFALDWARHTNRSDFEKAIEDKTLIWFLEDKNYPAALEPEGNDFLSPALCEAELVRRILTSEFKGWFRGFLPRIPSTLLTPVEVLDRFDGHLVHLEGLNLSRSWCLRDLSLALEEPGLEKAARRHLDASLPYVVKGSYMATHWLNTFAVLALGAGASESRDQTPEYGSI